MTEIRKIDDKVSEVVITAGDYRASIYTYGAILHSFSHKDRDIVLGYDSYEPYLTAPGHLSEVVGPYANRIADASFEMDGRKYVLEKNNGPNNLHSGSKNFGSKFWKIDETTDNSVKLSLESPEAGGFPGNHHAEITYTLTDKGDLSLHYYVDSDKKCPVNVTNHAYFNLNGYGDIKNHKVMLTCPEYLAVNDVLIPVERKSVEGTAFDFRTPAVVGSRNDGAYDHCFIFGDEKRAVVEGDDYILEMTTDLPSVQFYTASSLSSDVPAKGGKMLFPFQGLALETEFFPDFPNQKDFPGSYTEPGKPFETTTTYSLRKKATV